MKKVFHQGEDVDFTVETLKPNVTQENSDISTNFVISVFDMVWFCTQVFREEFGN